MENKVSVPKRYPCLYEGCGLTFLRPGKLAIHIQIHEGKKPFQCNRDGCNKEYTTKAHLKRHQEIQHEKLSLNIKIKCTVEGCNQEFSNSYNMQRHVKVVHNKANEYTCNVCKQGFRKKRQLHQHSYLHTGDHYYKCDICNKGFNSLNDCTRHKRKHRLYECKDCSVEFERWSDLRKHSIVHKPILKCTECHYKTKNKLLLNDHVQIHLAPGSRKRFRCTYKDCKRNYFHEKNLQYHVKNFHEGIKKTFQCPAQGCTASLSRIACLKKHLVVKHSTLSTFHFVKPRRPRSDFGVPRNRDIERLIGMNINAISSSEKFARHGPVLEEIEKVYIKCEPVLQTDENQLNQIQIDNKSEKTENRNCETKETMFLK